MKAKVGRNDPCPCGLGNKYKYCCMAKSLKPRKVVSAVKCGDCGSRLEGDIGGDFLNVLASAELPLKNFCKDNDFYFFSTIVTMGAAQNWRELLQQGKLTKQAIIDFYKSKLTQDISLTWIDDAAELHPAFSSRKRFLVDAVKTHFDGKYTLSVPVLFAHIEGLVRDIGGLDLRAKFKPTVPTDIWNNRFLFGVGDSVEYFNAFVSRLFEGGKEDVAFNRNPVLHGMNVSYDSEEWSILLVLVVLELRLFIWFEKNTNDQFNSTPTAT